MLVAVDVVRPLRASVLRPGLPFKESVYPFDDEPFALHVAVVVSAPERGLEDVLAVGSLLPEPPPQWLAVEADDAVGAPPHPWWRIRGMATEEHSRGRGLGRMVLDRLLLAGWEQGGGSVWCNARVPALAFYVRAGFQPVGEVFEVPVIGPHQAMWRALGTA